MSLKKKKRKKKEFSKTLLVQESILVWLVTLSCLVCCFVCIFRSSFVELPWLSALIASVWGAYGVSQAFYYKKSEKENIKGGIVFENSLRDLTFGAKQTDTDEPVG